MRDLKNNSTQVALIPAKNYGALAATTNLTAVDLKGEGRKLLAILTCGEQGTATASVVIQESSDNSSFTTLHSFDAVSTDTVAVTVDLTPSKRYVRARVSVATTDAVNLVVLGLTGIVYNERYRPSNVA
jgi:hypothetical protein